MTIRKIDMNKTTCLELCEMINAMYNLIGGDVCKNLGDRFKTAYNSIGNALVENIESYYLPEKKKYEIQVLPNICERVEVEALDEHEAMDIACGIVDKKYPDHDGIRIHACKEVK